jgi:bacterioferritin-associated ferredoxin
MILCLCKGTTDKVINKVISGGAETVKEVGNQCGAGTCCGMCRADIRELLSLQSDKRDPTPSEKNRGK